MSFRRGSDAIYPEEYLGERRDVLSNMLSIYPGEIPSVFSFRFRATERRKVRDGVPVKRNRTIGVAGEEGEWGREGEDATAAVQTGLASSLSHRVAHFGDGVRSKKRRERAVT